ncbi:MAG: DUF4375 domain-containing protein [Pseudomonadota bacterium]
MSEEVLRLSEGYFHHLLTDEDPLEAVTTLSEFWSPRSGTIDQLSRLSPTEKTVELCMDYSAQVCNGGHAQYFFNRETDARHEVIEALKTVGLHQVAAILEQAVSDTRVDKECPNALDQRDREFYERMDTIDAALQAFLRTNLHDVLVAERTHQLD